MKCAVQQSLNLEFRRKRIHFVTSFSRNKILFLTTLIHIELREEFNKFVELSFYFLNKSRVLSVKRLKPFSQRVFVLLLLRTSGKFGQRPCLFHILIIEIEK